MPKPKPKNPFYILLMVVGTAFALTATGFGAMTVRMGQSVQATDGDKFFATYGMWIMGAELTLLTLLTFAAIATDDYWMRGAADEETSDAENSPAETDRS